MTAVLSRVTRMSATLAALAITAIASPAFASDTWEALKPDVYGDRAILDGRGVIEFDAPTRPADQSNVPINAHVEFDDGRTLKRLTFIVDENPSPVAADFTLGKDRTQASIGAHFRLNQATDVRVVAEASDGRLYMVEQHVKFAGGQAACSAPPAGSPEEIAATMGIMTFQHVADGAGATSKPAMSSLRRSAVFQVRHPNHTGMVLDQISLLYIPLRIVTDIDATQDGETVFEMKGSMTLSQDPQISFDYRPNGSEKMDVRVRDSDGFEWKQAIPLGRAS